MCDGKCFECNCCGNVVSYPRKTYRVFFGKGNQTLLEATHFYEIIEYLKLESDYYTDVTLIEEVG